MTELLYRLKRSMTALYDILEDLPQMWVCGVLSMALLEFE